LLAVLVNRHLGWRMAVGASAVWIFCPPVWDAAVTGDRLAFRLLAILTALWLADALAVRVWAAVRRMRAASAVGDATSAPSGDAFGRFGRWNRLAVRVFLCAAVAFALGSLTFHDYRLGEAATVCARGLVDEAAGRCVVLDGVLDDQVAALDPPGGYVLPYDMTDAYRTQLVARVAAKWPERVDFRAAAQVSPAVFVETAAKALPDAFYLPGGRSASLEGWERRWAAFRPYLSSRDPVVPQLRRAFAREGNALANRLQDEGDAGALKRAWQLYDRIFNEIDSGNFSALVNMSEMIRRGHPASVTDRENIRRALDDFFGDARRRDNVRLIARLSGPVRTDAEQLARVKAEVMKRLAERKSADRPQPLSKEMRSLVECNGEMVRAMEGGDFAKATAMARRILSRPGLQGFVPANAVMGAVTASEGDYASSERFFRAALSGGGEIAAVTYNDFADTLLNLGKLDEAERMARRAVADSKEDLWIARMTLAETLVAQRKSPEEVRELLRAASKTCPLPAREKIRELKGKAGLR